MTRSPGSPGSPAPDRVSPLELFFDLVFAFTVTQVTTVIVDSPNGAGIGRAAVELAVIFWMYGGFAWLTNTRPPDSPMRRAVLLVAMGGFFAASLCVPSAFGRDGIGFGIAYLAINIVHGLGFVVFNGRGAVATACRLLAPNLVSSGLVLAAGWTDGTARWVLWLVAIAAQWITGSLFTGDKWTFEINSAHFAERHGLVILILLGESLISIGQAGTHAHVTAHTIEGVLAGLATVATLWCVYFVSDADRASDAMVRAPALRRPTMALTGYFGAHLGMIFGILVFAAGARLAAHDLTGAPAPTAAAWLVAAGPGGFLLASAIFRSALHFGPPVIRALGGSLCLGTVPVGIFASAAAEMVAVAVVIAATLWLDSIGPGAATRERTN